LGANRISTVEARINGASVPVARCGATIDLAPRPYPTATHPHGRPARPERRARCPTGRSIPRSGLPRETLRKVRTLHGVSLLGVWPRSHRSSLGHGVRSPCIALRGVYGDPGVDLGPAVARGSGRDRERFGRFAQRTVDEVCVARGAARTGRGGTRARLANRYRRKSRRTAGVATAVPPAVDPDGGTTCAVVAPVGANWAVLARRWCVAMNGDLTT
jgi:hypothetical protein